ncbi:integrase core domain-containing protein [Peribacillus sp. CSMR9]|uniref:integrase core domain-containing protein n=1 Tax=Peribacillus sp. CSMR9 TaxID=2981350 RepID=UPI0039890986
MKQAKADCESRVPSECNPRKGNCWDNAPMESFFGHFKDLAEYKTCTNLTDVKEEVDRVIEEYNESRYQWGL